MMWYGATYLRLTSPHKQMHSHLRFYSTNREIVFIVEKRAPLMRNGASVEWHLS